MTPELITKAIQSAAHLRELEEQKAGLRAKLEKSLHITLLWPDVFTHGKVKSHWEGAGPPAWHLKSGVPPHKGQTFVVTDGNGETRSFSFDEVSTLLGGGLQI
jgi:hypothetical protein